MKSSRKQRALLKAVEKALASSIGVNVRLPRDLYCAVTGGDAPPWVRSPLYPRSALQEVRERMRIELKLACPSELTPDTSGAAPTGGPANDTGVGIRFLKPCQRELIESAVSILEAWQSDWFPRSKLKGTLGVPKNNVDDHFSRNYGDTPKAKTWKRGGGNRMEPVDYHRDYLRIYIRSCWRPSTAQAQSVHTDGHTEGTDGQSSVA